MPRTINNSFRTELEASRSRVYVVIFATITHPNLLVPIRVNSDVVDYVYQGDTYVGAAFEMSLPQDDENFPQAQVAIHNVDQVIGETIQALATSPRIDIQLFAESDFSDDDPRVAIGTPVVEYSAPYLQLRNVKCDVQQLTADLVGYDLSAEPWPSIRSTKNRLPGLYR